MERICGTNLMLLLLFCTNLCILVADASNNEARRPRYRRILKKRRHQVQSANIYSWPKVALRSLSRKSPVFDKDKSSKPHIIYIIADDLGYNDVGYHGKRMGSIADTPAIDALAYSGVRLENYYVQPSCTPTRASLLTGRYPIRLGLQVGNIEAPDPTCLPLRETTLPDKLRDLGYGTHAVGKWHLGFSRPACLPTRRGFDSYFGIITGFASHYDRNRNGINSLYTNDTVEWGYDGIYSSELYTQRTVDIIKNHNSKKPLFLYLSHQAAHTPMEAPERYERDYQLNYPHVWNRIYDNKFGTKRKKYLGMVKSLDVSVHVVTETLKETGMWNNTVLIFTSDNGGRGGGGGNNWPLRGKKNTLWEGGIKGVGFVHSPLLPIHVSGTVHKGLMHVSDWFPTLVEGVAGGVAKGPLVLDGRNMWPSISQGQSSPRREILHNIATPIRSKDTLDKQGVMGWRERLIWGEPSNLSFNPTIKAAIRHGAFKLVTGPRGRQAGAWEPPPETRRSSLPMLAFDREDICIRLYNIDQDPLEKNNVAYKHPHAVHRLLRRLGFYDRKSKMPKRGVDRQAVPRIKKSGDRLAWRPWLA
ncbi:arylsulfatase B-like [Amphiura filiformis]|uniref:arylsulfatase B-like n=1 Tax=Amphiura filiformis TaxID=82378 RepID=UPI003B22820F